MARGLNGVGGIDLQSGENCSGGAKPAPQVPFCRFAMVFAPNRVRSTNFQRFDHLSRDDVLLLHSSAAFGIGLRIGGEQSPPNVSDAGVAQW
jgi:hypothetical protein